ncbi:hypothetical protein MVEN_00344800 [Mycena venus]|uniref:Uncharacterized protein n=1 Tax=Mycena venus TaxID=2733690 RepID=A0A8H7D747_9AGAR|nr:hypothetical protein MVEN_00344800 [Mycena venus]
MCFFPAMQDPPTHLITSLLFALTAAIPNHTLRYTALSLMTVLAVLYGIRIRSTSTQLRQLSTVIDTTEVFIRDAMVECPQDYFTLTEQIGCLLEINKSASLIRCRILNSKAERFSWTRYRKLSDDIGECVKRVWSVRTAVELIVEAEHQHKLAEDISKTQFILGSSRVSWNSATSHHRYSV